MHDQQHASPPTPVVDVPRHVFTPARKAVEHHHGARGTWVDGVTCGAERTHYHRTAKGMSSPAPNRPGHVHRLPDGGYTQPAQERWSSAGITRL
jgi:hypothetical protein